MVFSRRVSVLLQGAALLLPAVPAAATVETQNQAKKLGFEAHNCLYCHASPHAIEPVASKAPAARPGAKPAPKPETIQLAPKP